MNNKNIGRIGLLQATALFMVFKKGNLFTE